jgi:ribosomal protein S18 acetylase RimI-like enzyme
MKRRFQIRRMTQKEVAEIAVEWAAREGWNPGRHDAACFYAVDPQGFLIGELDGKPVAVISAVAYDDHFGFMGFYIVKPEFRGMGYGIQIWRAALDYLGSRNIGGDGVLERIKAWASVV